MNLRRLYKDLKYCHDIKIEYDINIVPREDNFFIWDIMFIPKYGIYKDIVINFIIKFPKQYPFMSPEIIVPYYIKHYYVRKKDNQYKIDICDLGIFNGFGWTYTLNARAIIIQLYYLFNNNYINHDIDTYKFIHLFYTSYVDITYTSIIDYSEAPRFFETIVNNSIEYNKNNEVFLKKMIDNLTPRAFRVKLDHEIYKWNKYLECDSDVNHRFNKIVDEILNPYYIKKKLLGLNKQLIGLNEEGVYKFLKEKGKSLFGNVCLNNISFYIFKHLFYVCNSTVYISQEVRDIITKTVDDNFITNNILHCLFADCIKQELHSNRIRKYIENMGYNDDFTKTIIEDVPKTKTSKTSKTSKTFDMLSLPFELFDKLVSYFDYNTKRNVMFLNKSYYNILSKPYFWERQTLKCGVSYNNFSKDTLICYNVKSFDYADENINYAVFDTTFMSLNILKYLNDNSMYPINNALPIIINEHKSIYIKPYIEQVFTQLENNYMNSNNPSFNYRCIPNIFVDIFKSIIDYYKPIKFCLWRSDENIRFCGIRKYIDTLSQCHYIYLKCLEWYPEINTIIKKKLDYFISHINHSLKDTCIFTTIILLGMNEDYTMEYLKQYLLTEILKKLCWHDNRNKVYNSHDSFNLSDIESLIYYNFTDKIYKISAKNRFFIEECILYIDVIEHIMRRDTFDNIKKEYSTYYGYLPRHLRQSIGKKLMYYIEPDILLKHLFRKCNLENVCNEDIIYILKDIYKCAKKNRYIKDDRRYLYESGDNWRL